MMILNFFEKKMKEYLFEFIFVFNKFINIEIVKVFFFKGVFLCL